MLCKSFVQPQFVLGWNHEDANRVWFGSVQILVSEGRNA
jgi:hypothetical protein